MKKPLFVPSDLAGHEYKNHRYDSTSNYFIAKTIAENEDKGTLTVFSLVVDSEIKPIKEYLERNHFTSIHTEKFIGFDKLNKPEIKSRTEMFFNFDKDLLIETSHHESTSLTVRGLENNVLEFFSKLQEKFPFKEKVDAGTVYAITVNSQGRLNVTELGNNGIKICRDNYNPEVIAAYDYIVEQLKTNDPDGRISILDGKPGTGKTYLIRSLLVDLPDSDCIIIPANVVANATTPELLTTLINHKTDTERKMVLIVEDADQVVTKRAGDNMSAVSTLLNLGDGIMGSVLDIRIVCTTNASTQDLDEAIVRPGRLCRHITVAELNNDQAKTVYSRLTAGKVLDKTGKFSLAEVYKMAKDDKFVPKTKDRKVGFV